MNNFHFKVGKKTVAVTNYFFGSFNLILNSFNGLLFVPLYLKKLRDIDEYGVWLACLGIISSLSVFEMNLSGVATQKYSKAISENKISRFKTLIASNIIIIFFLMILCSFVATAIVFYYPNTIDSLNTSFEIRFSLILCFLGFIGMQLSLSIGAFFQSLQITLYQNTINSASLLINTIIVIFCLYYYELGIISFSIGYCVMGLFNFSFLSVYSLMLWQKNSFGKLSFKELLIREMLRDSAGLTMSNLSLILKTNLQAPLIAAFVNPSSAAILNITGKIISISGTLVSTICSSVYAGMSQIQNQLKREEIINKIDLIIEKFSMILIGSSIFLTKNFILLWMTPKLYGGIILMTLIVLSQYFLVRKSFYSTLLMTKGKFNSLSIWVTLELIVNTLLLILFFNLFSNKILAFPLSTLLSTVFINIVLYRIESGFYFFKLRRLISITFNFLLFLFVPLIISEHLLNVDNKLLFLLITLIYTVISFILSLLLDKNWSKTFFDLINKVIYRV